MIESPKHNKSVAAAKPGDFPLGSVESRAAMRMRLVGRPDDIEWSDLYVESPDGKWHFGEWSTKQLESGETVKIRRSEMPVLWLAVPAESVPQCQECGTPFARCADYHGVIRFQAVCRARHDPEPAPPPPVAACPPFINSDVLRREFYECYVMQSVWEAEELIYEALSEIAPGKTPDLVRRAREGSLVAALWSRLKDRDETSRTVEWRRQYAAREQPVADVSQESRRGRQRGRIRSASSLVV